MYDDNQTFVPDSFIALYSDARGRLTAPRETIAARHEFCEDMAFIGFPNYTLCT